MRLNALPTTSLLPLLFLLLPLLASVAAVPDDEGKTSQSQTSTSTLTITRTLYTVTATATSVLALTIQTDGTTLLTYPDIQKPTGTTDSLADILLATPLPITSSRSAAATASSLAKGTGTGVVAPSNTATGAPIAKFTGAATRGRPHVLALVVAIGLAAGVIA